MEQICKKRTYKKKGTAGRRLWAQWIFRQSFIFCAEKVCFVIKNFLCENLLCKTKYKNFIYKINKKLDLTQHTILSTSFTKDLSGDVSIADWICNAVEGNVESYGLELLR